MQLLRLIHFLALVVVVVVLCLCSYQSMLFFFQVWDICQDGGFVVCERCVVAGLCLLSSVAVDKSGRGLWGGGADFRHPNISEMFFLLKLIIEGSAQRWVAPRPSFFGVFAFLACASPSSNAYRMRHSSDSL